MTTSSDNNSTPSLDEINDLLALLYQGSFSEAETFARQLTERFPLHGFAWKVLGTIFKLQGELEKSLTSLEKAVTLTPDDVQAHNNLGATLGDLGRLEEAGASYNRALDINPDYEQAHNNLGGVLYNLGRFEESEASFRRAVEIRPDFAEAFYNLGKTLHSLGRLTEAEAAYCKVLEINPTYAEAYSNLGVILNHLGRFEEAEATYRRVLEIRPDYAEAHYNLAITLSVIGRLAETEACCRRALEFNPNYVEAHITLGNTLNYLGRLEEAEASYRRAIQLNPDIAEAHSNLGKILCDMGRLNESESSCRRALEIKPDYAEAHYNMGNTLKDMRRLKEAEASYRRALEINPEYVEAYSNLGNILKDLSRLQEAEACYRSALEIRPDHADLYNNLLFCLTHNFTVDAEKLFYNYCRFGEQFESPFRFKYPEHTNLRNPVRSLRIGFVSADLRDHAMSYFIEPVLVHLSTHPKLSLHAYSNHVIEDPVTVRLRNYFAEWHLIVGLSDAALDEKIRADSIDILIDLSGHTAGNRLLTFARKPAPVQASWMGFPATTGLRAMDYYLADRYFLPDETYWAQFTEKIVFLPASAPFVPFKEAPSVNELPVIKNGYMTFGSFNRSCKLSPSVITIWARLLRALPDSRIVLGAVPQDGHDTLIDWFAKEGIEQARMSFKPLCSMEDYLGLHHQVDICLDTLPFNGGTTTCHALWMGVPTLTIAGSTPPGMTGAAILGNVGLESFVARDTEDFVRKGLYWAKELESLANIRSSLRQRFDQSALGQPVLIAEGLERAFRIMWQRWCQDLPPVQLDVSPYQMNLELNEGGTLDFPSPEPTDEEINEMVALLNQSRYSEAETFARQLTERFPQHGFAWKVLGVVLRSQGCAMESLEALQKAVALSPDDVQAHDNLGATLNCLGRLEEAIASYRRALEINPGYVQAHNNLGATLYVLSRLEEAEACFRHAVEIRPDFAEAYYNLGKTLHSLGRLTEAEAAYCKALEIKPDYAEAYSNLGAIFNELCRFEEAEANYRRALELRPDYAEAHYNLALTLSLIGRLAEAEACCRQTLEIYPDFAEAHTTLGNTLNYLGRLEEAEASYLRAKELNPHIAEAHSNLGKTLQDLGRLNEAEASCRRALEINPNFAGAYNNLGKTLKDLGKLKEAEASYRRAVEIEPDYADAYSNLLLTLNYADGYSSSYLLEETRRYGQLVDRKVGSRFSSWRCDPDPKRLRVGMVSGDFGNHPVGYFLESLLGAIDQSRIELIAYPTLNRGDALTERIKPYFSAWKSLVGLGDEAAASLIHQDGVHLLIDLSGHTANNRLPVFARKPAPVQVSWLGYFATTGLAEMDYFLADEAGVPKGLEAQFTEKVWYLPETRLCFSHPEFDISVNDLPALQSGHITYGSFQNMSKVGDRVLAAWGEILRALPDAILRLQNRQLDDSGAVKQLVQRLQQHGIDSSRVSLHGSMPRKDYLASHAEVDLILDTFPFSGGTTTCEALWMGVPTLTLAGDSLISRQGASLLTAARLNEWVAVSETDYIAKAIKLAGDPVKLAVLRSNLRHQVLTSPLFDAPRFARNFEEALWGIWREKSVLKLKNRQGLHQNE